MTRSNDAMPDWNTFIIDASCVSGIENLREYWMNAWMSPMLIAPLDTRRPPTTATMTYWMLPMNIVKRLHQARHELRAERRLVELVVGLAEPLFDLALAAERLHDRVARERLLDLCVEQAGALPLRDELGAGTLRDRAHAEHRDRHGRQRHDREQRRDREHHDRDTDEQQDRREHLAQRLLQALGDVVDVVGDPAQQVAALLLVDVAERQRR